MTYASDLRRWRRRLVVTGPNKNSRRTRLLSVRCTRENSIACPSNEETSLTLETIAKRHHRRRRRANVITLLAWTRENVDDIGRVACLRWHMEQMIEKEHVEQRSPLLIAHRRTVEDGSIAVDESMST